MFSRWKSAKNLKTKKGNTTANAVYLVCVVFTDLTVDIKYIECHRNLLLRLICLIYEKETTNFLNLNCGETLHGVIFHEFNKY